MWMEESVSATRPNLKGGAMNEQLTYRKIAKLLSADDDDIERTLEAIKKLNKNHKIALKAAYIFACKVPHDEKRDAFQEFYVSILESCPGKKLDDKLAYAIARARWIDWWRHYELKQHYDLTSMDEIVGDDDGDETTLSELLIGEAEFELKMIDKLDFRQIFNSLPDDIRKAIGKRLLGKALSSAERMRILRWVRENREKILANV